MCLFLFTVSIHPISQSSAGTCNTYSDSKLKVWSATVRTTRQILRTLWCQQSLYFPSENQLTHVDICKCSIWLESTLDPPRWRSAVTTPEPNAGAWIHTPKKRISPREGYIPTVTQIYRWNLSPHVIFVVADPPAGHRKYPVPSFRGKFSRNIIKSYQRFNQKRY